MSTLVVSGKPLETETLLVTMDGLVAKGEEVHVIFVQSGVGNAADVKLVRRLSFARSLSCLDADVKVIEGVKLVDFHSWVRLIEECEKVVSWT